MEFTAQQPSEADGVDSSTDPGTTATATQWWMSAVDTNSPTFWFTVVLGLMMLGALPYIYDSFVHPCLLRFGIIRENVAGAAVPFSQAERQRHRALKSIEAKHAEAVAVQREKIAQKAKAEADRLNELLHPTPAGIGKGVAVGKGDGEIARLASRVKAGDAAGAAALARAAQLPRTTPGRTSPLPDAPTAAELQGGTAAASAAAMFAARDQDRNLIDDQEREYQEAMAMDAAMAVSDRAAAAHDAAAVAAAATLPKRLTADELHQRRRQVAEARLPAEPAENEDDDVLHLVIRCMDWRGDTKVMRRFRKADRVSVVMDFVQARLPGGLEKRQLAVMHPKQLICTWNDYDLKGFDSEAGFEQVTAAAASAASATNASASSSAAAGAGGDGNAAASAPVGLSGVAARTLADVGLQNRTVLVLRPMDAEAVFH